MRQINETELFDLFNDTLNKCGYFLLKEDDNVIGYNIYEEFDIGVHSFLHLDNLKILYDKGFISLNKLNKCVLLREKFIQLQNSKEWSIENFRISQKWKEIMILSDEIKALR